MRILNGWKEIAECLNLTQRTAQRWERLGLPVRRVSNSRRSPIIAFHHEIEYWMRNKTKRPETTDTLKTNLSNFSTTIVETRKLVAQLRAARQEHHRLIQQIKGQVRRRQAPSVSGSPNLDDPLMD